MIICQRIAVLRTKNCRKRQLMKVDDIQNVLSSSLFTNDSEALNVCQWLQLRVFKPHFKLAWWFRAWSDIWRPPIRTRPGFQVQTIRSSPRRISKCIGTTNWRIRVNILMSMSVSMSKLIVWSYISSSRSWTIISSPRIGKKQFKSLVQHFHGISSPLTWCHSARLIEWYSWIINDYGNLIEKSELRHSS